MKRKITEEEIENIVTMNRFINSENNLSRIPLERENNFLNKIRNGNYREVSFFDFSELEPAMGRSTINRKNYFIYITVAGIALAARAAIDGGLQPDTAFDISEAMMQKLEQTENIDEMHDILDLTGIVLAHEVLKAKRERGSYVIEQSKNYISHNIFKRIFLKDIARYVGVTPEYLSNLFSKKEGMTIQEYIQREKMDVACNLLKYSDNSISEISQYIGYQSQSNFSAIFRKWKNQTPSEYREKNRTNVFIEK